MIRCRTLFEWQKEISISKYHRDGTTRKPNNRINKQTSFWLWENKHNQMGEHGFLSREAKSTYRPAVKKGDTK